MNLTLNNMGKWFSPNHNNLDSKVHGANMGPIWVLSAPDGPHVGPMNLAIRENTISADDLWGLLSVVITWSNPVRYHINNYKKWGRISIRCWIHPYLVLTGELYGVFCEYLKNCEKNDQVIAAPRCICKWGYDKKFTYACYAVKFTNLFFSLFMQ